MLKILKAQDVTITGKLTSIEGEFGTLKANVGTIDKLTVTHTAKINELEANKASITQLEAVSANIGTLEATVGKIETLVNGNLTSDNIQSLHLTSASVTVENSFIKSAMIESLDINKVNAGDISTNKFKIRSDDGGIEIVGATQQFKDKNNKVRIQMGQDTQGNFNFIIRGEDGTTTLIDHTGIKKDAIADDLIISDMIASDAVGEKQINYSSFITGFNKDTNTNTIKSTKIMLNNQNQTLDVAFSQLKTQADGTKSLTESHSTTIGVMQGQISTAINNTKIVKDGQTILLKDDYNRTVQTIDSMKSTIGSHTSQIDGLNSTVNTQGSSISQLKNQIALKVESTDITNAINSAKSYTDGQITTVNKTITDKVAEIKTTTDSITQRVSSTESKITTITTDFNNLQIGGRNLLRNTGFSNGTKYWNIYSSTNVVTNEDNTSKSGYCLSFTSTGGGVYQRNMNHEGVVTPYENGEKLVISGYVKCTSTAELRVALEGVTTKYVKPSSSNTWTYFEFQFVANGTATTWTFYGVNGNSYSLKEIQVERGTKRTDWVQSQEDIDSDISSVDSKITTVSNKVATIETNLNSITSRVSSTETTLATTTSTANNALNQANTANNTANANKSSISSLTTRMSTAESKLTKDSLTTTIGSYYTTSTDVNGIVTSKGYQTSSQVQQTVDALQVKFTQSGGYNLLRNSTFANFNFEKWFVWGSVNRWTNESYYKEKGDMFIYSASTTEAGGLWQDIDTPIKHNTKYTLSVLVSRENSVKGGSFRIEYTETVGGAFFTSQSITLNFDNQRHSYTFTTPNDSRIKYAKCGFQHDGTTNTSGGYLIRINKPCLCEGEVAIWSPHPNEICDGITTIDKDGITVLSSNVNSKTNMSANGFKITNTSTNRDVFKVQSNGQLYLEGEVYTYKNNKKSIFVGDNVIKFFNWNSTSNEEMCWIYNGINTSTNDRVLALAGIDTVEINTNAYSDSGKKHIDFHKNNGITLYNNLNVNDWDLKNVQKINYGEVNDVWINNLYIRSNQVNTNMSSGTLWLNYWQGVANNGCEVKVGNGANDGSYGSLYCQDFKAYGTKNSIVQTSVGHVGINAYETCDYYFGDIGETILDNEGYSYVYIDSIFSETVNTNRKYQVFLSVYGEGTANVIERTPNYFVIKGTPNIEIGYEIKAKRKGYEDYRLEREKNGFKVGSEHGLDLSYEEEKRKFNEAIENAVEESTVQYVEKEQESLMYLISKTIEELTSNKELIERIEVDINENIN